jgi:hypothetical protein
MDHQRRAVLAQRQVGGAPEEVPALAPLLADLNLDGVVVTADALHTHHDAAWVPGHQQAGALPAGGQGQGSPPRCGAARPSPGKRCPSPTAPATAPTAALRVRTLKVVSVRGFGMPHAAQVTQVTRKTRQLHASG